jgi:hypothetical protein
MQATMTAPAKPQAGEEQRAALWVIATVAVAILLGWLLKTGVESRSQAANVAGGISFSYPAGWVVGKTGEGVLFTASDPRSPTSFRSTVSMRTRNLPQGLALIDAAASLALSQSQALPEFSDLGSEQATLAGRPALRLNYAYVAPAPAGAGRAMLPTVVRATDTLVALGNQILVISTASDADYHQTYQGRFDAFLRSVKLPTQ